eukprot:scaffold21237_cov121-Isochrysis_galbana.AAC.3
MGCRNESRVWPRRSNVPSSRGNSLAGATSSCGSRPLGVGVAHAYVVLRTGRPVGGCGEAGPGVVAQPDRHMVVA